MLGMSLNLKQQYLQMTFTGVRSFMGSIEDALREVFFPAPFGGEEVSTDIISILCHSISCGILGIPDPRLSVEERGGGTPQAGVDALCARPDTGYGGNPQDLRIPPP